MEILTASEIGKKGAEVTNKKYAHLKAKWGRKGGKIRWARAKKLSTGASLTKSAASIK